MLTLEKAIYRHPRFVPVQLYFRLECYLVARVGFNF